VASAVVVALPPTLSASFGDGTCVFKAHSAFRFGVFSTMRCTPRQKAPRHLARGSGALSRPAS